MLLPSLISLNRNSPNWSSSMAILSLQECCAAVATLLHCLQVQSWSILLFIVQHYHPPFYGHRGITNGDLHFTVVTVEAHWGWMTQVLGGTKCRFQYNWLPVVSSVGWNNIMLIARFSHRRLPRQLDNCSTPHYGTAGQHLSQELHTIATQLRSYSP